MSVFNFPQFEDEYDGYKMRVLTDEIIRQFQALQQEAPAAGGGGGGGATDHGLLTGRSNVDQHPIAAITGLQAALNAKANQTDLAALTLVVNSNTNAIIALQIDLAAHLADVLNPHDVTLQQAYDQVTTPPQVNINATPDPLTIDATVAGDVFAVRDDANVDLLRLSTTGGQVVGGSNALNILSLVGSSDPDLGFIHFDSPMVIDFDYTDTSVVDIIVYDPVIPSSGAAVTSFILMNPDFVIDSGLFIASTVRELGTYNQAIAPGFAVQTVFLGQPTMETTTPGVQPNQSFMFASQALYENVGAGVVGTHVANVIGVTHLPRMGARVAGDTMSVTNWTGMTVGASFGTVAGTTIDFGTIRGVLMQNPALGLFQPGAGVEGMDAFYGLDVPAIAFDATAFKAAVRSALVDSTLTRFLWNIGTAQSEFGAGDIHLNDNTSVKLGNTSAAPDILIFWDTATSSLRFSPFFGTGGNPLDLTMTAADEAVWGGTGLGDIGIGFDVNAVVFGTTLPTPNSNNWFVQFAAPNLRQVQIGGEYSDVLWTAGGSIDVNGLAVSDLQAFKINSPAVILNGGTIADISNLFVSAMPSFGATRTQALRVLGRARIDGHMNSGSQSPAQITANQNDFQLGANNNQRAWVILDADADWNITGIDASFGFAQTGDRIYLYNDSNFDIALTHQDAASLAANRFICPESLPYVIHQQRGVWLWYDDTGTLRWRVMSTYGHLERALHLSGDQFRKGATAPTDVTIGTTPTIPALLFNATNELASLYHSLPADADLTQDIILRLQFSLSSIEVNLDTCDFTCDYTAVTLVTAEGIAKASTSVTGQFTAVTGRLAVGDLYEMDITFTAGDATNPLATAIGIAFEIHMTNVTGVADIHLIDGDFIYTALRS